MRREKESFVHAHLATRTIVIKIFIYSLLKTFAVFAGRKSKKWCGKVWVWSLKQQISDDHTLTAKHGTIAPTSSQFKWGTDDTVISLVQSNQFPSIRSHRSKFDRKFAAFSAEILSTSTNIAGKTRFVLMLPSQITATIVCVYAELWKTGSLTHFWCRRLRWAYFEYLHIAYMAVCVCVVEKRIFVHCCSAWLKIDYKQISKRYRYTGHRLMVQMRRFIIRFSIEIYLLCHKRGTRKTKAKTQSFSTGRFNYVNSWTEHIYNAYAYCY